MSDPETLAVYAAKAQEYNDRFSDNARPNPSRDAFIADMPAGARVLDLGCGPGASAEVMAAAGLMVEAWDIVPEMVAFANARPGVSAKVASFDNLTQAAEFHGIWANFSLLHAPREALPRYTQAMARALKPSGLCHIGMKTGTDEKRDTIGRKYTYVTEAELEGLLEAAGLAVIRRWQGEDKGLDGQMAPWVIMQAEKPDA